MNTKHQEIVQAAIELFHHQGFHATSMQDLADAVGLQKGSLYHYISSKEDLLVSIIQEALGQYNAGLVEIKGLALPVRERLELAVRHHLKGIAENLGMLTIFLRESYALRPEQQEAIMAESHRYNRMFEDLFAEGVRTGEMRNLDPKLATRVTLGACNWLYRWYRPDGPLSVEQMGDFFISVLFGGIVAGSPALAIDMTERSAEHDGR